MARPLTIIKMYVTLAVVVGVLYLTLYKAKQHGNIRTDREDNKGKYQNQSVKLEN